MKGQVSNLGQSVIIPRYKYPRDRYQSAIYECNLNKALSIPCGCAYLLSVVGASGEVTISYLSSSAPRFLFTSGLYTTSIMAFISKTGLSNQFDLPLAPDYHQKSSRRKFTWARIVTQGTIALCLVALAKQVCLVQARNLLSTDSARSYSVSYIFLEMRQRNYRSFKNAQFATC